MHHISEPAKLIIHMKQMLQPHSREETGCTDTKTYQQAARELRRLEICKLFLPALLLPECLQRFCFSAPFPNESFHEERPTRSICISQHSVLCQSQGP